MLDLTEDAERAFPKKLVDASPFTAPLGMLQTAAAPLSFLSAKAAAAGEQREEAAMDFTEREREREERGKKRSKIK